MASRSRRVSSRVRKLRKSCSTRHTRYRSKEEAINHIHQVIGRHENHRIPVRAFPCGHCNGWHLTSQLAIAPETGLFIDGGGI